MPAAITKAELIAVTRKEYDKLRKLIDAIPEAQALRKREDGTSIKDVIGCRAHWARLFLGWYEQGRRTGRAEIPAAGYRWNELKRLNADLRAAQAGLGWEEAKAMLEESHRLLLGFLEARTEAELYGAPMRGGGNAWTTGRWAGANGASHYRSAAKWIRGCLRADAG